MITLTLTAMAPGGEAVGRHEGMVVFVPLALAGERVEIEIVEQRSRYARGRLLRVLEASPERVAPACRHFGACGGCAWQHIDYAAQVRFKTEIVREQMARVARLPHADVRPCVPSPSPYAYRNSARMAAGPGGRAGYRAAGSHRVIPIAECPILEWGLQEELEEVRRLELEPGDEVALRVPMQPIAVGGFSYQVSPESFFQVNTAVAQLLAGEALRALALQPGEAVLDLYCGAGLFTLPAAAAVAGQGGRVLGIEANGSAAQDARRNLAAYGHASILTATVENALARAQVTSTRWDAVLLDPPRKGVEREALARVVALQAARIVYVSCDPATLARDAAILSEAGYRMVYAQPFDMFPQTAHVETVALFVAGEEAALRALRSGGLPGGQA